jgi:hypothetical protein
LFLCKKHGNISENGKFKNLFFFATFFLTHWLPWTEKEEKEKKKKREEAVPSGNTPGEGQS